MTDSQYINKLTQKFAAARKVASYINQASEFPGAEYNVGRFDLRDPTTAQWQRGDQVSRFRTPLSPTFGTYPTNSAWRSPANLFPSSNLGTTLTNWGDGEETPATTSGYVALPGVDDYTAQIINSLVTGATYGGLTEAARRGGNALIARKNTGELISPIGSLKNMTKAQIDAALMDRGIPIDGLKTAIPGVDFPEEADEALSKRQAVAEYIQMQAKDKTLTPGEYAEYRTAAATKPGLTLEQFRATKSLAGGAGPTGTGRVGHHHKPVPIPFPSSTPTSNPEVDLKRIQVAHGSDKNLKTHNINVNRNPMGRSRVPAGWLGPVAAGVFGLGLPWIQHDVNFGNPAAKLVPIDDARPGDPNVAAPLMDESVRRVIRQAERAGVEGKAVDFNDPYKKTNFK